MNLLKKLFKRTKVSFLLGLHLLHLLYVGFLRPHRLKFVVAAGLNVMGRVFSLFAFIASIQAVYVAFKSTISHDAAYPGKSYVDWIGISHAILPWVLAVVVLALFLLPAILKRGELVLVRKIVQEAHEFVGKVGVSYATDLFVIRRMPALMVALVRVLSALIFIFAALLVVAILRFELFLLVLAASLVIGAAVIALSLRNIIIVKEQAPLAAEYSRRVIEAHQSGPDAATRVPANVQGPQRDAYFQNVLSYWSRNNMAGQKQLSLNGVGLALIIVVVFQMQDLDSLKLFLLAYLVIAIRFSLNTAREVGVVAAKILEARTEIPPLTEIFDKRLGRDHTPIHDQGLGKTGLDDLDLENDI